MKIAFFVDNFLGSTGGIQNSIHRFKQGLESLDHEVAIFTNDKPGETMENDSQIHLVPAFSLFEPGGKFAPVRVPLTAIPLDIQQFKPDVIHVHTQSALALLAWASAHHLQVPLVYTFHMAVHKMGQYFSPLMGLSFEAVKMITMQLCEASDAVIAPGRPVERYLKDQNLNTPVHVVSTGVDTQLYAQELPSLRKKLGIGGKTVIMLSIQRMREEKRIDFVIRAFAKLLKDHPKLDTKLVISGDGPHKETLMELIQNLGIEDDVIVWGFLPEQDLVALYQTGDVFLMASLSETQGLVPLEASAAGTPVLSVHDKTLEYCIKDGVNGIFTKDSEQDFADGMYELIHDSKKRKKLASNARGVASEFSIPNQAKKLMKVYAEVLKRKR